MPSIFSSINSFIVTKNNWGSQISVYLNNSFKAFVCLPNSIKETYKPIEANSEFGFKVVTFLNLIALFL